MDPVDIGDWKVLDRIERDLRTKVVFVLRGNKIVAEFHRRTDGVAYRFRHEGDIIHVEREVDIAATPRGVDRAASELKKIVQRP